MIRTALKARGADSRGRRSVYTVGPLVPSFDCLNADKFAKDSNANHIVVHEGDSVNIYCPHYVGSDVPQHQWEYYKIYLVSKESYDMCVINDLNAVRSVLVCNNPLKPIPIQTTLLVLNFNPQPSGIDFNVDEDYYFISTSHGHAGDMINRYHGACHTKNMKMVLQVREKESTPGNSGGSGNNNNNNGGGNNNGPDQPRTQATVPPTLRSSSTTTTTTTTTTARPTSSTAVHTKSPTRSKPLGGGANSGVGKDGEPVPGSDGFPNDDTVIHAHGGRGGQTDNQNINSGIIDDSGSAGSALSLYSASVSLSRLYTLFICLVIGYLVVPNIR
ncbi:ephrin-b2 [Plakobranchus ocellatus]|uniref:Ephrin-b2 n=1 Tax=Plakobranchus ocellatus TaxID=259542 RepID=A0AAV4D6E9_9GAST|nr:ephrin-b2 [Plakobranchus ocellatus]